MNRKREDRSSVKDRIIAISVSEKMKNEIEEDAKALCVSTSEVMRMAYLHWKESRRKNK